jgi:PKD repeat protein
MNRYLTMFGWRSLLTVALLAVAFSGCNKKPVADFTLSASEGPAPLTVTFTDASVAKKGTITAWQWDFKDGETSDVQNPVHTFQNEGVYEVSLTVTDSQELTGQKTAVVTVTEPGDTTEGEGEPAEGEPAEGELAEGEGGEGEDEGEAEGEGEPEPLPEMSLLGWTRTVDGNVLPGVKITVVETGAVTKTDANGLYRFYEDVIAGDQVVVKFQKEGYATSSVIVRINPDVDTVANATMKALAEPIVLDAGGGGEVSDVRGNKLVVPANAFVRRDNGKAVEGDVDVHITPLDVTDEADLAAFPGEFLAVAAGAKADDTVQLETFALADFTVMQDDADLDLNPAKAEDSFIELVLPENTTLTAGEQVPLWYFDEEAGLWLEEGVGDVIANKAGELVYRAPIAHLSWWNCDKPISETHCITGQALDSDGAPIAYARIEAQGVDYNGSSYVTADANGNFCVNVKRNATVDVNLYLPGGTMAMDSVQVIAPDTSATCNGTGDCTLLPRPLRANFDGCVGGLVIDVFGRPLVGVKVYSSLGITSVTDDQGRFCMSTPASVYTTLFVAGRPPVSVTTSAAEASCSSGGCVQVLLNVDYPEDGSFVGTVTSSASLDSNYTYVSVNAMFRVMDVDHDTLGPVPDLGCFFVDPQQNQEGEWYEGEWPEEGEGVQEPDVALDPGAPGLLTNGADIAELPRFSDLYPAYSTLYFGMFGLMYEDAQLFSPGDPLNFSWPGGMDISAFNFDTSIPGVPAVTYPVLDRLSPDYMNFPLDADVNVLWAPTGSDYVQFMVTVGVSNPDDPNDYRQGMITCITEDDGTHIIPANLMQQLPTFTPEEPAMISFNAIFVMRDEVEAPLTQGGNGIVQVMSQAIENGSRYTGVLK